MTESSMVTIQTVPPLRTNAEKAVLSPILGFSGYFSEGERMVEAYADHQCRNRSAGGNQWRRRRRVSGEIGGGIVDVLNNDGNCSPCRVIYYFFVSSSDSASSSRSTISKNSSWSQDTR